MGKLNRKSPSTAACLKPAKFSNKIGGKIGNDVTPNRKLDRGTCKPSARGLSSAFLAQSNLLTQGKEISFSTYVYLIHIRDDFEKESLVVDPRNMAGFTRTRYVTNDPELSKVKQFKGQKNVKFQERASKLLSSRKNNSEDSPKEVDSKEETRCERHFAKKIFKNPQILSYLVEKNHVPKQKITNSNKISKKDKRAIKKKLLQGRILTTANERIEAKKSMAKQKKATKKSALSHEVNKKAEDQMDDEDMDDDEDFDDEDIDDVIKELANSKEKSKGQEAAMKISDLSKEVMAKQKNKRKKKKKKKGSNEDAVGAKNGPVKQRKQQEAFFKDMDFLRRAVSDPLYVRNPLVVVKTHLKNTMAE